MNDLSVKGQGGLNWPGQPSALVQGSHLCKESKKKNVKRRGLCTLTSEEISTTARRVPRGNWLLEAAASAGSRQH